MKRYTKEELAAIGEQVVASRARDLQRAKARNKAVKTLISAHADEYQGYLAKALEEV